MLWRNLLRWQRNFRWFWIKLKIFASWVQRQNGQRDQILLVSEEKNGEKKGKTWEEKEHQVVIQVYRKKDTRQRRRRESIFVNKRWSRFGQNRQLQWTFYSPFSSFSLFHEKESEISLIVCFLDSSFFLGKRMMTVILIPIKCLSSLFSCLLSVLTWCLPVSFVFLLFLSTNRDLKTVFFRLIFFSSSLSSSSCVISLFFWKSQSEERTAEKQGVLRVRQSCSIHWSKRYQKKRQSIMMTTTST